MHRERIAEVLHAVAGGELAVDDALSALRKLPFAEIVGSGRVDHHRSLRTGTPEVVYGANKTPQQIIDLMTELASKGEGALATRVHADKAEHICARLPQICYQSLARVLIWPPAEPVRKQGVGVVAVVSAGTSDESVASEAALTLEFLGHEVVRVCDVGVAGLPRTLAAVEEIAQASVVIVCAGMEGALPSVLAGLIDPPMVAVPTSVGYGVGFGGYVAMMAMLAGCAPGVTVVNIDNGFGAAVAAARINSLHGRAKHSKTTHG